MHVHTKSTRQQQHTPWSKLLEEEAAIPAESYALRQTRTPDIALAGGAARLAEQLWLLAVNSTPGPGAFHDHVLFSAL